MNRKVLFVEEKPNTNGGEQVSFSLVLEDEDCFALEVHSCGYGSHETIMRISVPNPEYLENLGKKMIFGAGKMRELSEE